MKIVIYPLKDGFDILFIAHHLLVDGRGLLGLVLEFADCYAAEKCPAYVEEQLISSICDLPEGSDLSLINRMIISKANRDWRGERHAVDYATYRAFEKSFIHENPTSYAVETFEEEKVDDLLKTCREQGVSLNDHLVAEMMWREQANRVVIAVDIRKKIHCYYEGALGNYATATGIKISAKPNDTGNNAKEVAKQVKRNLNNVQKEMMILACYLRMDPELIDAAAISTMGNFQSKAGRFVGSLILGYKKRNGYSVTNLGNVNHPNITEAMFIPPASPANKKTMGVLSVNHRMKKCTVRYENESPKQ